MSKILITGSNGLIGSELVEWLEDSVAPRLGVDYVSKYVPWIKQIEERVKEYKEMHGIDSE